MFIEFQDHINSKFPFLKKGKKLLVAVSGGIDSVVLTHLLHQLKLDLQLAHCNFCLREKESDQDEQFVIELANKLQLKIHTKSFDTQSFAQNNKVSVQMAARQLRYQWFQELVQQEKLDYIITAHNLDDNLETFLINFTRGTGLEGLCGIAEVNETIVRPLLVFSRLLIEKFAIENNIKWREDSSNAETKYIRNKIRHQVIPLLKEINPGLLQSFKQTSKHLLQSRHIISEAISDIKPKVITSDKKGLYKIDIRKINELSNPTAYLYELLKAYNFTQWNDVHNLLDGQSGKQIISSTHRLIKDRDFLLLELRTKSPKTTSYSIEDGQTEINTKDFSIHLSKTENGKTDTKTKIFVDADKMAFPLTIRKWQNGDYFYPFGMTGKKKLSKFFKDEKFSLIDKENTWILTSGDAIVWVLGERMDDRFKVTEKTKKIIQIEYCK